MTARERFARTMAGRAVDRVPLLEEGLRDDVLATWQTQGLASEAELRRLIRYDRREEVPVNLDPLPELKPWPTSQRALARLRKHLNPADPRRWPADWPKRVAAWRQREHLLQLPVHRGFFLTMGVHDWGRFLDVMYLLEDDPALVEAILGIYGEFYAAMAERVLREVAVDFAVHSEPIGGNDGPLLSPSLYRRFVLKSCRPLLRTLHRHAVPTIVFVTYANSRALLPSVFDAGFNCLWAIEAPTDAMDYRALRRQFGRSLRLIGGIDLDVLRQSKTAIRRELEAKVPPLLRQGGCIPLADGRVRANVPWENYRYYRRYLEGLTR